MKPRKNVIVEAATAFLNRTPRKLNAPTLVDSVLPGVAEELSKVTPFEPKTPLPRGMSKTLVTSIIERVLTTGAKLTDLTGFLVPSEVEYITLVLDEVYVWAESQGFEVGGKTEVAAS
jgi:hypothetical protein